MTQFFDLFGDPIPANRGRRGRPQHIATIENRNKVTMLLALGWSNERIAAALRITPPSLRKHYFSELKFREIQRDRLSSAIVMKLWQQVDEGNVAAIREFNRFLDRNDAAVGHREFYADQRREHDEEEAPLDLGKKEIAARDALTAGEGSAWGDDLKPH